MSPQESKSANCPRCGSGNVVLRGQSVQYGPEERAGQSLQDRELQTLAYQCECGLAFTQTIKGGGASEMID
jgi:hypothetical protein